MSIHKQCEIWTDSVTSFAVVSAGCLSEKYRNKYKIEKRTALKCKTMRNQNSGTARCCIKGRIRGHNIHWLLLLLLCNRNGNCGWLALRRSVLPRTQKRTHPFFSPSQSVFRQKRWIEQAGFRADRSCCGHIIDLSSAYDTVWRRGLLVKLLKVIPSRKIGDLVNTMLGNKFYRVFLGDASSRTRRLNDGFPQGSVCALPFFNHTWAR